MGHGDLAPRIITHFAAHVDLGDGLGPVPAEPVNLSETGVCIRLAQSVERGRGLELHLALAGDATPFHVPATVAWTRWDQARAVCYCGIGFADLPEPQRRQIRDYVEVGSASLLAFLSEFPLFGSFDADDCRGLLRIVTLRRLERGELLYADGDEQPDLQGLFIVQAGLLSIFRGPERTRENQLAVVSPGQVFGEMTLIEDGPHSVSVTAVNPSRLIQINKLGFRLLRQQEPHLALKLMDVIARTLAARLGRTTKKWLGPVAAAAAAGKPS